MTAQNAPAVSRTRSVALAKIESNERKWIEAFRFGSNIAKSVAAMVIVYLIMHGLESIVLSKPENIDALSRFVEKIRLGEALGYILAGVMGFAYNRERKGKKRLIQEKGRLQNELEKEDPSRSSSGLDINGDNPEGEE